MLTAIISAFLLASSLAQVLADYLVSNLGLNLFSGQFSLSIPSFSMELGTAKTFDLLYFALQVLLSGSIFWASIFVSKNRKAKLDIADFAYLAFSFLLYLQTHFVRHSGTEVILLIVIVQLFYLLVKFKGWSLRFSGWIVVADAILSGFFGMLIIRQFTTSLSFLLGIMVFSMAFYHLMSSEWKKKFVNSPFHLFLIIGAIFPWNRTLLLLLGLLVLALILVFKKTPRFLEENKRNLYFLTFILLLAYDPIFYFGNLDSVEEGFWLGWLQRLLSGQILYKDVAVYHPPLITWGLSLFVKAFGVTIYSTRLYFHILKIIGVVCIFYSLQKLVKTKLNLTLATLLTMSFTGNFVRNNVEIRVGLGLLALSLLSNYFDKKKSLKLITSGLVTGILLAISLETGIATALVSVVSLIVVIWNGVGSTIRRLITWFLGVAVPIGVIVGLLVSKGALNPALKQIFFYTKAFSSGYFNIAIPRSEYQNMLQWWRVDRYLSSQDVMWEVGTWFLIVSLMYLIYRVKKSDSLLQYRLPLMITGYALVLSRVTLGRSDWYHLLFMLIPAVLLITFVVEQLEKENKVRFLSIGFWIAVTLVFARSYVQDFFTRQIFKLQSYANISQTYKAYKTERSGIALDIDAPSEDTDNLIDFLSKNTGKEDKIFTYPWNPELYFLADRNNATSFDTPYAFFTTEYQLEMIKEIKENEPKYIILNPDMNFANMSVGSLPKVQSYINDNYGVMTQFGKEKVMVKN